MMSDALDKIAAEENAKSKTNEERSKLKITKSKK